MHLLKRTLAVTIILGLFWGLSIIFVLTRLYIRKFIVKKVDYDDYFLILTLTLYSTYGSVSAVAITHDFSSTVDFVHILKSLHNVSTGLHYWFFSEVFYILTCLFLRISVAILLARIASTKLQRNVIYGTLSLMIIISITFLFVVIFQCSPVEYYWTQWIFAKGSCVSANVIADMAYAHSGVSFVADWILGLLPIWLLWKVQISVKRKIAIATLLGMGLLCGVAAIIRTPYIRRLKDSHDFAQDWQSLALCSTIEPGLGIIAASFAAFRPLFLTKRWQSIYSRLLSTRNTWSKVSWSKRSTTGKSAASYSSARRSDTAGTTATVGTTIVDRANERELEEGKVGIQATTEVRVSISREPLKEEV